MVRKSGKMVRITNAQKKKILNRFYAKCEEFEKCTDDELVEKAKSKMSETDRQALNMVILNRLNKANEQKSSQSSVAGDSIGVSTDTEQPEASQVQVSE